MALAQFWRERQADFEKYQLQFRNLEGHWYASSQTWWLQCGESRERILRVPQHPVDVFTTITRTIDAGWGEIRAEIASKPWPHVAANAEPWEVWLDYMRVQNWAFDLAEYTLCTKYEWDAVRDGEPLDAVRRGRHHWLQKGTIKRVFESSALLCEELATANYKREALRRGYRSEIRAYMNANNLKTIPAAALHLAVGMGALKSIMSSKGRPHFTYDTLNRVLGKIGHKGP